MRNKEDKKCKKGQESTIGKIIYGFLLFMPLFAILSTCLYTIFNKNAYKSYSGNNYIQYTEITNFNEIEVNSKYSFDTSKGTYNSQNTLNTGFMGVSNIDNLESTDLYIVSMLENPNMKYIRFYYSTSATSIYTFDSTQTQLASRGFGTNNLSFTFTLDSFTNDLAQNYSFINKYQIDNYYNIDNVFYYSVDKVTESPLFNWAESSIIYTTTNNTCNALSITTPFIPLLLSYWLIISVIYFLYDIALMLVWIIHRKIHEMQESI